MLWKVHRHNSDGLPLAQSGDCATGVAVPSTKHFKSTILSAFGHELSGQVHSHAYNYVYTCRAFAMCMCVSWVANKLLITTT